MTPPIRYRDIPGTRDVLLVTLDTLRFDAAAGCLARGTTPYLARRLGPGGWERRHSPGSFTFAAHQAFFAGFLPTPASPGPHARPFALAFPGSETTGPDTLVFDSPTIVQGFSDLGYRTICIGGVGFFNRQTPLGRVLPGLFDEAHWEPRLGVTEPRSTEYQVDLALERVASLPSERRVFLFLNVSAIHQPNRHYLPGAACDTLSSHAAALEYVDGELGRLFDGLARGRDWFAVVCSDHGTAYGEDGFHGHRLAHPAVWDVPYAEFRIDRAEDAT